MGLRDYEGTAERPSTEPYKAIGARRNRNRKLMTMLLGGLAVLDGWFITRGKDNLINKWDKEQQKISQMDAANFAKLEAARQAAEKANELRELEEEKGNIMLAKNDAEIVKAIQATREKRVDVMKSDQLHVATQVVLTETQKGSKAEEIETFMPNRILMYTDRGAEEGTVKRQSFRLYYNRHITFSEPHTRIDQPVLSYSGLDRDIAANFIYNLQQRYVLMNKPVDFVPETKEEIHAKTNLNKVIAIRCY